MIGLDTEIGITHPDIKECDECGGKLYKMSIENHGAGGWFKALECFECSKQFNIRKFTSEEYRILRNKLSREISTLKKANLCKCKEGEEELVDGECWNCEGNATPKQIEQFRKDMDEEQRIRPQ